MKVEVLQKLEYKGCPVYIRKIGNLFEYLVIFQNELYSNYIDIKSDWYRIFLKDEYTKKQLENIIKLVLVMAHKTIDKLKSK